MASPRPCRGVRRMGRDRVALRPAGACWARHRLETARCGPRRARSRGFERAYLWVLADNVPAPAFYERRGLQLLERENVDEIAGELLREACYAKSLG